MSKPKNWPDALPYLKAPLHAKDLTEAHLQFLRSKPSSPDSLPIIPAASTPTPSPLVKITPINNPSHPAHTQHGLFAAQNLPPGSFIIAYLGRAHSSASVDPASDYDIWLDRDADVAVDAARGGNEARFVNDYRGVRERPNAEFRTAWCERWGEACVAVWVLGQGKKARSKGVKAEGIRKGEEICVSYGKGFWGERMAETGGPAGDG